MYTTASQSETAGLILTLRNNIILLTNLAIAMWLGGSVFSWLVIDCLYYFIGLYYVPIDSYKNAILLFYLPISVWFRGSSSSII